MKTSRAFVCSQKLKEVFEEVWSNIFCVWEKRRNQGMQNIETKCTKLRQIDDKSVPIEKTHV